MSKLRYQIELGILSAREIEDGRDEGLEWRTTPHQNRIAVKGPSGGIDCLHYLGRIMVAAGMVTPFQFPYYHHAVGVRDHVNVMEALFCMVCDIETLDPGNPVTDGDVMVFSSGFITNHTGIVLSGQLFESSHRTGVTIRPVDRYRVEQFQSVCRLRSRGFKRQPESLTRIELYAASGGVRKQG